MKKKTTNIQHFTCPNLWDAAVINQKLNRTCLLGIIKIFVGDEISPKLLLSIKIFNSFFFDFHFDFCFHLQQLQIFLFTNVFKSTVCFLTLFKGGFFSESVIRFSDLQIKKKNIPKNYPDLEISGLMLLARNLNFKLRIVFWKFPFWRFEKHIALSEKSHL